MTSLAFRPRIGPWLGTAILTTGLVYLVFSFMLRGSTLPHYPFAYAALIGGGRLAWDLVFSARKYGLRVDDAGLTDVHTALTLPWDAITAIRLEVEVVTFKNSSGLMRIARIEAGGSTIRFADLGPGRPPRVGTIVNLSTAGLVLAVVTARTRAAALYPPKWNAPVEPESAREPLPEARVAPAQLGGPVAVVFKIGPKIGAVALKLFKTIKLGSVALTIGAYALVMSWKFAVALVGMVLFHECGHVYAMWRSGVPVKGIYLIPYFGGAAVSQGVARTRARSAYIAINGPVWGATLAGVCFVAFAVAGPEHRFLGTLAAWGALINLFNLLPIFPLDGGRIITSLASASRRGVPVLVGSLVLGAAVAYFAHLDLIVLVGFLGLFELAARVSAAIYNPAIAMLGGRELGNDEHEHFGRQVAFVELARDTPEKTEARRQAFARIKAEADQTPMTSRQTALVLAGYLALIGALVGLLYATANIAGSGSPLNLLR